MILEKIEINNFGIYNGYHSIELEPTEKGKPIILFGGLNGGGKTTLLDAFNLALYGSSANCSNRGKLSYFEYLSKTINNATGLEDNTFVSLSFTRIEYGKYIKYKVLRSYNRDLCAKGKEQLKVFKDGEYDEILTESWTEYVDDIIPSQIASLFFFDGEKIEQLADLKNSSKLLSTAITSLFGVDILDKLSMDLNTYEKKKLTANKKSTHNKELEILSNKIEKLKLELSNINQHRAEVYTKLSRLGSKLKSKKKILKRNGGDVFFQRDELEKQLQNLKDKLDKTAIEIMKLASDILPLNLLKDKLEQLEQQYREEEKIINSNEVIGILKERDSDLLEILRSLINSKDIEDKIVPFFSSSIEELTSKNKIETYLELSKEGGDILVQLNRNLAIEQNRADNLVLEHQTIKEDISLIEQKLGSVPDESTIVELLDDISLIEKDILETNPKIIIFDEDIRRKEYELDNVIREFVKISDKALNSTYIHEDNKRIIKHSRKVAGNIEAFKKLLIKKKLTKLEQLILDSFSFLIRKEELVKTLSIDPIDFTIEMTNKSGDIITPERLSAGERQLLATSILWGLAQASGRPIPTIIDTPLGRLDSVHREKLVNGYFPNASHQIILLSTDTEITEYEYKNIKEFISREYVLEYDKVKQSTVIKKGYFPSKIGAV